MASSSSTFLSAAEVRARLSAAVEAKRLEREREDALQLAAANEEIAKAEAAEAARKEEEARRKEEEAQKSEILRKARKAAKRKASVLDDEIEVVEVSNENFYFHSLF